ncbi:hypothetical protein KC365_g3959 [Hortaea werneckii]|nr:hypothetical protein KC365_g3959 [Hortaea werneckii]
MRAKTLEDAEELRRRQFAPVAKPTENNSDEEDIEQAGCKAKSIKNGGDKEDILTRRAGLPAKRKRAKRRVAKIEAELGALGHTAAITESQSGASYPNRPSTPKGIPDTWIRMEGWMVWEDEEGQPNQYA